jgi:hypothetical protein
MLSAFLLAINHHLIVTIAGALAFSILLTACPSLQRETYILVLGLISPRHRAPRPAFVAQHEVDHKNWPAAVTSGMKAASYSEDRA